MKRNATLTTLTLILGALFAASSLFADDHQCTYKKAAGDFGYTATGIRNGIGPVVAVGRYTLDVHGNVLNGSQTISFAGLIAEETFTGTVSLNSDCTGTAVIDVVSPVLNRTTHTSFVIVDNDNEARQVFTDPDTILTLEAKRIFRND